MPWDEHQLDRLASVYARVGYVPGPGAPVLPPDDIPPAHWFLCLYLVPDGVGQQAYEVAVKLADLLGARTPGQGGP
jgi:hypothetical protein